MELAAFESDPKNETNPKQDEEALLQEIKVSLGVLQESHARLQQNVSHLVNIQSEVANNGMKVFVENVNMPFFAMVGLMVKWTIASIPAAILVMIIGVLALVAISLLCGGLTGITSVLSNLGK